MKILLDTNFILTCVKQKIDFHSCANEIVNQKIEWLVPQDVIDELDVLKNRKGMKFSDRDAARLSFEIVRNLNPKVIKLPSKNPNVDMKIVNYIVDKNIVLATLDKNLKNRIGNRILTIRGRKNLELI